MRKLCTALFLTLGLLSAVQAKAEVLGSPNQIACNQLVFQNASVASLKTILAGVAGRAIFICGWHVTNNNAAAATFVLSQGTGTDCATTNTAITPAWSVANTAPATDHIEFAPLSIPTGANLCITSSATTLQVGLWVGQY